MKQALFAAIQIMFSASGFAVLALMEFLGLRVSGGCLTFLLLGAWAWLGYKLSQPLVNKALGIRRGACPARRSIYGQLLLSYLVVSVAEIVLVALALPQVLALKVWLSAAAGGVVLLFANILSNVPTQMLERIFFQEGP